jgi:hypothetical protein
MDKAIIELLARRARLNNALEEFPEDGAFPTSLPDPCVCE